MHPLRSTAAAGAALLVASTAVAAPCNRPDVLYAMPPDGAEGVPTDAVLAAKYAVNAEYLGEEVVLEHEGVGETSLTASFDAAEGVLRVTPSEPLVAGDTYVVRWPRLRGLASANLGRGKDARFTVGTGPDQEVPLFGGVTDVEWDVERERDDCSDTLEKRYVFDLRLGAASDDGGRESLTLLVFKTRGPDVDPNAPKPILVRSVPSEGHTARVSTTIGDGVGEVCFAALVRDLTGKTSSGSEEVCVETVEPPFFEGCSSAPGRPAPTPLVLAALVFGLVLRRRTHGR